MNSPANTVGIEAESSRAAEEGRRPSDDRLVNWLLASRLSILLPLAALIALVKNGFNIYPVVGYTEALARHWTNPKASPLFQSNADFLLSSPTSAVAAGILHLTSDRAFLLFHFALCLLALFSPFCFRVVRKSRSTSLAVLLVIVGGPAAAVLFSWVGSYDPVSFGAGAIGALAQSPVWGGFGWALFAFNNSPEAAVAFLVYGLVRVMAEGRVAIPRLSVGAIGGLLGYLSIHALTAHWGGSTNRVAKFQTYPYGDFVSSMAHYWPLIVFSSIGAGWFIFTHRSLWRHAFVKIFLAATLSVSIGVPFIALDETRVIAAILWPAALLVLVLGLARITSGEAHAVLRRASIPAIIVPVPVVWTNAILGKGWDGLVHLVSSV